MKNRSKKGQASGLEVSILIILISLFIGAYVILLPPEEREGLLGTAEGTQTGTEAAPRENILLSETPGRVEGYRKNVQEITLEPMHLYVKDDTTSENLIKSLTVSKSLLSDNYKDILFTLSDLSELKAAKVTMMPAESKGKLKVKINGYEVYEGELQASDLPIELPKAYLKKENVLQLSVSSPGWKLFSSNRYTIKDLNLIKELSTRKTKASRTFSLDMSDNKARKAELAYFINCNKASDGELTITLNDRQAFKDRVFCEYLDERKVALKTENLKDGRNTLDFEIDDGDYNIDEAELRINLEKSTFLSYSFEANPNKKTVLSLKFPTTSSRNALITVNDKQFEMSTAQKEYTRDITDLVKTGTNTITVKPEETFEITKLEIRTE